MTRVPFTILTGWLGAGKTSALNRMLAATHGARIAVLVNELGRISIDTQLILGRGGDVLELAGGCVCCKVDIKNDLWDGIADIVARSSPDAVVLETTGIAEPAAILDGLIRVPDAVRERIVPAGVVCVVDAEAGAAAIERRDEAREQAMSADRVMLAKLDVATGDAVRRTHAVLDAVAPEAERAAFPAGDAGARAMTAWVIEPRRLRAWTERRGHERDAHGPEPHAHHHRNQIVAVTFTDDAPLIGERVLACVEALGDRLIRAKGFVHLAGEPRRGFIERAGIRTELRCEGAWGPGPRRTELVLIGDGLDEAAIHRALWACRAMG
ncbi:MAG: GTP-binding protein [Deltaproteobacteria bacterium]|nr:MAG: GTP-binding protein [Deltaproteobacteria bacterium]TMQ13495.1 MAG: GTP-binding protein [Deltaproteobacteria bacterium]